MAIRKGHYLMCEEHEGKEAATTIKWEKTYRNKERRERGQAGEKIREKENEVAKFLEQEGETKKIGSQ